MPHFKALPSHIRLGISSSAFQIEGGVQQLPSHELSAQTVFFRQKNKTKDESTGDVTCDHFHRYKEDVALLADLGVSFYRFGLSWARLMPQNEEVSAEGLAFYHHLIDELLSYGIEPWICLCHWDMPQDIDAKGGWSHRSIVEKFTRYAQKAHDLFGDKVKSWLIFNQPRSITLSGHVYGDIAPGFKDLDTYYAAIHHVNLAQGDVLALLKPKVENITTAFGLTHNHPYSSRQEDHKACEIYTMWQRDVFLQPLFEGTYPDEALKKISPYIQKGDMERIHQKMDLFGLNYYRRLYIKADKDQLLSCHSHFRAEKADDTPTSSTGWEVRPHELKDMIMYVHQKYKLPVSIFENGLAQDCACNEEQQYPDTQRIEYINQSLQAVAEAVEQGAQIGGYCYWSLMDNFEWGSGFTQKFGLVHHDPITHQRTPKESYHFYRQLCQKKDHPLCNIQAVFLSLNDVLVKTSIYHMAAWQKLGEKYGWDIPDDQLMKIQESRRLEILDMEVLDVILKHNQRPLLNAEEKEKISTEKKDIYLKLIHQLTPESLLPGSLRFIKQLKKRGIKMVLISTCGHAEMILQATHLIDYFHIIIDTVDTHQSKSHKPLFLQAAQQLNLSALDCVAIEATTTGVQAAQDAQIQVIAIGKHLKKSQADIILASSYGLDISLIKG